MQEHYKYNQALTQQAYQLVVDEYPEQAERAHQNVAAYLRKYDKRRLGIFLGETGDPKGEAVDLYHTLYLIADMLHEADSGNPECSPQNIDIFSRGYLRIPYAAIKGGKT